MKIKFSELIKPNSGKSSTRYAGLVSLYSLVIIGLLVLVFSIFKEIPRNNADILSSIAYTLGAVVLGAFTKTVFEKQNKNEVL